MWGTCHHSLAVLQCGAVQNCHSEPKIHLAGEDKGGRRKDGDMRKGKRERMRKGIVEGCRDGAESVVLRSVLYCALLSPLLGIIRSMNISLITAEKAERSRVEDACHTAPSARITGRHQPPPPPPPDIATPHSSMSPALHISPSLPFPSPLSLTLLTLFLSCSFFLPHLCSLSQPLHPALSSSYLLLVCVTVSFVSFPSLRLPPSLPLFSSCSGWIETFCLLQGMLFLPY